MVYGNAAISVKRENMKILVLFCTICAFITSVNAQVSTDKRACPINKMEAYILDIEFDEKYCEITTEQEGIILKLRKEGRVERTYHLKRRMNSEVGIFDD